jgi:squalene-hopene/tetraprenyl-beta-curcumene cyclase
METETKTGRRAGPEQPSLEQAIERAGRFLLGKQHGAGYWYGPLEADASVTAGYIPLMYFLKGGAEPERQRRIINYLRSQQGPDGMWPAYRGGPGDLSVSLQVYLALKIAGIGADETILARAREGIVEKGGVENANAFTRIWLAIFGQYRWDRLPALPPELIWLPGWFPISIYDFASWSRETIVALMLVLHLKPVCRLPRGAGLEELAVAGSPKKPENPKNFWGGLFGITDRLFKAWEKLPSPPGRRSSVNRAEQWLVSHQEKDGSWGGILLPWVYALIGLKETGYSLDHPVMAQGLRGLEGFIIEDADTLLLQPATSPVWDTAWAVVALREAGFPAGDPALQNAARWLLSKEVREPGDWSIKTRAEPGCWSFEFENRFYPDIDDTAVVPRALKGVSLPAGEEAARAGAVRRGTSWVLRMQGKNGGWAAFDRDNDKKMLENIPLADFMTPLDPTSSDVTAHVLELLVTDRSFSDSVQRARRYLRNIQEADGSWYGRWGVNYIYGTGLTLAGLQASGEDMRSPYVRKAADWLVSCQNGDGGWGEACRSYDDPSLRGRGQSTASQTAWALLGLSACGGGPEADRGAAFLLAAQKGDGSWDEDGFTGTGFPRAFYLRYDLYRIYFPLLALSRYREVRK